VSDTRSGYSQGEAVGARPPTPRGRAALLIGRLSILRSPGFLRMDQKFWYLKGCSLFECLTDEQVRRLESRAKTRDFKRGSLIYLPSDQGDCVFVLGAGRVKIIHNTHDGKQALLAIIDPGEIFGELALSDAGPREEYAEAMEASTVVLISVDEINRLMDEHPNLQLSVMKLSLRGVERLKRRLKALLFRSNRERVVHLLFDLSEKYGKLLKDGSISIEIRLSHQELASIVGSTRETVTLVLGELQQEGAITVGRKEIVLRKVGQLAEMIEMPVPNIKPKHDLWKRPIPQNQRGWS
jgi:CRP/FNR family transcriptional regulator, cyclic AMP receptor protein